MQDLLADIAAQPAALLDHIGSLRDAYASGNRWSEAQRPVVMTGMATSLYAWHSAGLLLSESELLPEIIETSEYLSLKDSWVPEKIVVVMSRSGESVEIARLANEVLPEQTLVGITEGMDSTLAQRAAELIGYNASEQSFCNTKSFTLSMALALSIAGGMTQRAEFEPDLWVRSLADLIGDLTRRDGDGYADMAADLKRSRVAMVISRGHQLGVAAQIALDIQEIGRIGAMPISGGLLRHGPLELILEPDVISLLLIPDDATAATLTKAAADIIAAGGRVLAIAADGVALPAGVVSVRVPVCNAVLAPFVFAVAAQRLNAALAAALGIDAVRPALVQRVTTEE